MSIAGMLKGNDLFGTLTTEEINTVSGFSSVRKVEAGGTIHRHQQPATHLFLLLKGCIHLVLPGKDASLSLVVSSVKPGDLFGVASMLQVENYTTDARCLDPCEFLAIEARPLRDLLRSNATAGLAITTQVARAYFRRYTELLQHLQNITNQIQLVH